LFVLAVVFTEGTKFPIQHIFSNIVESLGDVGDWEYVSLVLEWNIVKDNPEDFKRQLKLRLVWTNARHRRHHAKRAGSGARVGMLTTGKVPRDEAGS
jgi:hypothetical protein